MEPQVYENYRVTCVTDRKGRRFENSLDERWNPDENIAQHLLVEQVL